MGEKYLVINDGCECQKCGNLIKKGDDVHYVNDNYSNVCEVCNEVEKWMTKLKLK